MGGLLKHVHNDKAETISSPSQSWSRYDLSRRIIPSTRTAGKATGRDKGGRETHAYTHSRTFTQLRLDIRGHKHHPHVLNTDNANHDTSTSTGRISSACFAKPFPPTLRSIEPLIYHRSQHAPPLLGQSLALPSPYVPPVSRGPTRDESTAAAAHVKIGHGLHAAYVTTAPLHSTFRMLQQAIFINKSDRIRAQTSLMGDKRMVSAKKTSRRITTRPVTCLSPPPLPNKFAPNPKTHHHLASVPPS